MFLRNRNSHSGNLIVFFQLFPLKDNREREREVQIVRMDAPKGQSLQLPYKESELFTFEIRNHIVLLRGLLRVKKQNLSLTGCCKTK